LSNGSTTSPPGGGTIPMLTTMRSGHGESSSTVAGPG
jgi:hypothetical protein